ncbi:MAG TPA: M3 family oligoendopeptidase [Anaerolineae bacterium]|nr:M3 family oligoendopeptidase [Anaerolineae bacterium]
MMSNEAETFAREIEAQFKPLRKVYALAMWDAATMGTEKANQRQKEAQTALMRFWSDPERFAIAKRLNESGAAKDPILAREIERLYLSAAKAQQDEATIEQVTALQAEVRGHFYNHRPEIGGRRFSDNELDDVLRTSRDSEEVKAAWLASKEVGALVADQVRALAKLRNAASRAQGYRDHFARMLALSEIDEDALLKTYDELEKATDQPFARLKEGIDAARAKRFGVKINQLRPWHFENRFFQASPEWSDVDTAALFEQKDLVQLALQTYDDLGMDVADIIDGSDLHPRPGKNQHAFCLDIDREGDVRTLNNLQANERWMSTLLHELGHAVYDKYIDPELPWMLRTPAHSLTTEGLAIIMGALTRDIEWLEHVLGLTGEELKRYAEAGKARERAGNLVFTRWSLVMLHFERRLYADPDSELDAYWWDLAERYQFLPRPDRMAPDWAAKYHIALAPVYYQSYELGRMVAEQFRVHMRRDVGGIVGRKEAGQWMRERIIKSGATEVWSQHVISATGEPLNPDYFLQSVS